MMEWTRLTPEEWTALTLSVRVAAIAAIALLIPGIACGWFLARVRIPGKTLIEGIVHLPLVLPPVVVGYLMLIVLGRRGLAGEWLYETFGWRWAFHWTGAVLASMVMAFPLMVRSVRLSVELIDPDIEEASRTLGAGTIRSFFTITLPLALPGILAGTILAFARALGEFGATITFAGNIEGETRTLPLAIFSSLQTPGNDNPVLRLTILSIVVSLAALSAGQILANRMNARLGKSTERTV